MTMHICDQLDAFQLGELTEDAAAQFEAHLLECDECRSTIQLDRQIDQLLIEAHQATDVPP